MFSKFGKVLLGGKAIALLAVGVLSVSGCANESETVCPVLGVLDSAAAVTKFRPGGAPTPDNVTWQAQITNADLDCEYTSDLLEEMEVNLRINMAGNKGPSATQDEVDLQYFVVITDRRGAVLTKKVFPATLDFDGQQQIEITEEIWQLYRLQTAGGGILYEIWVGFQLTDEEINFNRQQRI